MFVVDFAKSLTNSAKHENGSETKLDPSTQKIAKYTETINSKISHKKPIMSRSIEDLVSHTPVVQASPRGDLDTMDFRVKSLNLLTQLEVSLWHDIPLFPNSKSKAHNIVNMVNEIPRCSRKKYEVATNEPGNPIKQDIKKGKLREFSKGDIYFNYGCIPQTWEDPDAEHPDAKAKGDNDPLDVCEIGLRILSVAEVVPVKVLGTLCLIDEGEADWKVIAIAVSDPWAPLLNDVKDLEELLPGVVSSIREWFRTYKITDGKGENKFGLEERCMPAAYAMCVIEETHHAWRSLIRGTEDELKEMSISNKDSNTNASNPSVSPSHESSSKKELLWCPNRANNIQ